MELEHEFTVPVPVEVAWSLLLDVERVAPCMPGATLDSIDGDDFVGRLKVRLGAMTITYRGTARIVSADEAARTVTIDASGKEARGSGTASATVRARLDDEGGVTRVTVHTKLSVTGRPAQFGRNILSEVGAKLIDRFAKGLAAELESGEKAESADAAATATATAEPKPAEAIEAATPMEAIEPAPAVEALEAAPAAEALSAAEPASSPDPVTPAEPVTVPEPVAEPEPVAVPEPEPAPVTPISRARKTADNDDNDAINLLEVAGPAVAKRAAPFAAAVVAIFAIRHVVRRRRGRHHRR